LYINTEYIYPITETYDVNIYINGLTNHRRQGLHWQATLGVLKAFSHIVGGGVRRAEHRKGPYSGMDEMEL